MDLCLVRSQLLISAGFKRIYGGFFIVLTLAWARQFDCYVPDLGDLIGAGIALSGVLVYIFRPR